MPTPKFTPEVKARFLAHLKETRSPTVSAARVGISYMTFYNHWKWNTRFAAEVDAIYRRKQITPEMKACILACIEATDCHPRNAVARAAQALGLHSGITHFKKRDPEFAAAVDAAIDRLAERKGVPKDGAWRKNWLRST